MIERWHHDAIDRFNVVAGCLVALVENVADETDRDELAAEHAGLVDLLLRCGHRHKDDAGNAEVPADESEALGVVAGRGTHESLACRAGAKHLAEKIERAPDLVGANRRKVLAFEEDVGAVAGAQMFVQLQRRGRKNIAHRRGCVVNILLRHVRSSIEFADGSRYCTLQRPRPSL
ncbi:hypothetical protein D3C72_1747700 [compost metagenome]